MVTRFLNSLTLVRISEIRFYHKHMILKVRLCRSPIYHHLTCVSQPKQCVCVCVCVCVCAVCVCVCGAWVCC